MPNPKRRHSKSRRDQRRAHDALTAPQTIACKNCGEPHLPHRMCPACGFYRNQAIKNVKTEE